MGGIHHLYFYNKIVTVQTDSRIKREIMEILKDENQQ